MRGVVGGEIFQDMHTHTHSFSCSIFPIRTVRGEKEGVSEGDGDDQPPSGTGPFSCGFPTLNLTAALRPVLPLS